MTQNMHYSLIPTDSISTVSCLHEDFSEWTLSHDQFFPTKQNKKRKRKQKHFPKAYLRRLNHVNRSGRPAMEAAQSLFAAIIQRKQPSLRCMKFTENKNEINTQINIYDQRFFISRFAAYFGSKNPKPKLEKNCKLKLYKSSYLHTCIISYTFVDVA